MENCVFLLKKILLLELNSCPTVRNGVVCGGRLKECQLKSRKMDSKGEFLKITYLPCTQKVADLTTLKKKSLAI